MFYAPEIFIKSKKTKSSGIGLYLCRHIVENKMNGSIAVANENEGVVFTIKF